MLTYCNAGHQQPLILRNDKFIELTTGGMALGIRPHESFDQERIELLPGDLMILTTDGVTDALNFQGNAYGPERLLTSIWKHRRLAAPQLAAQLHWDVRRFAGLAEQADDITIVVVKVS
jgi:sigma-B regulation protein RsbU (phosphoserine phosphatase)